MGDTIDWSVYNKSLFESGKLSFWLSQDLEKNWYNDSDETTYSDWAIEVLSVLRFEFGLKLREVDGLSRLFSTIIEPLIQFLI